MTKRNKARLVHYYRAGSVALLPLVLMARAQMPDVSDFLHDSLAVFTTPDQHALENFIRSCETQVVVVSSFLMILQAIVASPPVFVIMFANASLFGAFWGDVLSWSSVMADTALCFFTARALGRGTIERLTGKTVLNNMDASVKRYDRHTILVCRLSPFVPFGPVSYAAGLILIRSHRFFIATGIGQLPATIVYSWAGSLLTGDIFQFVTGLLVLFAPGVAVSVVRSLYLERRRKKNWDLLPFLAMKILCVTAYCV